MKQYPRVAGVLYGQPWAILPDVHAELGMLYRNWVTGALPTAPPQGLSDQGEASYGISYLANHATGICIVEMSGVVTKRAPEVMCGPQLIDLARLDALVDEIEADEALHTVVLDINTPGGCMIGLEESCDRLRELAMTRRVVAYTDMQMCSAGYFLACACDEIYAAPSSVVGSIGVYCAGVDDSRAWEFEGLELILAKSGQFKAMGHPGKAWTTEERAHLQDKCTAANEDFQKWVTSRRPGVEASTMEGQWFFAKASPAGLVDGLYRDLPQLLADLTVPAV